MGWILKADPAPTAKTDNEGTKTPGKRSPKQIVLKAFSGIASLNSIAHATWPTMSEFGRVRE